MSNEQTMTPAEAATALQQQLEAVEDRIGQVSIDWRRAAANPGAMAQAAAQLQALERERDMLQAALAEAQQAQAAVAADENGERVLALIERAREQVAPMLDAREQKGRQLEEAVLRVATLVLELHEQAKEIRREWPVDAATVSGVDAGDQSFHALDSEDLYTSINQMLAWRLGRLWPEERAPAHRDESLARRIQHEVGPIRYAFEEGVKQRAGSLRLPAA